MIFLTAIQAKQMADMAKIPLTQSGKTIKSMAMAQIEYMATFTNLENQEHYRFKFTMHYFSTMRERIAFTVTDVESAMKHLEILGFQVFHGINATDESDFWNVSWG